MATTTNYGWTTPDDTALVKDGASAIRSLGTSIDTTTKNLNPSTTLGDIEYRSSTANTNTRLGIGSTGNVLTVSGGVPVWAAPAGGGKVLQVVSATTTTQTTITSGTLTDTGITASITPSANTSKILVIVSYSLRIERSANRIDVGAALKRDATSVMNWVGGDFVYLNIGGASSITKTLVSGFSYYDSPATTSSTTYKVQGLADSCTSYWQYSGNATSPSTITLIEIGA
jgi:hypothetical protein